MGICTTAESGEEEARQRQVAAMQATVWAELQQQNERLWALYDDNKNNCMDRAELRMMIRDLLRIMEEQWEARLAAATDEADKAAAKVHLEQMLPAMRQEEYLGLCTSMLDKDDDHHITKQEYLANAGGMIHPRLMGGQWQPDPHWKQTIGSH